MKAELLYSTLLLSTLIESQFQNKWLLTTPGDGCVFPQPLKLFVGPQSNSYHNFFFSQNSQNSGVNSLLEVIKAVSLRAGDWKNTVLLDKRPVISVHPVNLVPNHDHIIQKVLKSEKNVV